MMCCQFSVFVFNVQDASLYAAIYAVPPCVATLHQVCRLHGEQVACFLLAVVALYGVLMNAQRWQVVG